MATKKSKPKPERKPAHVRFRKHDLTRAVAAARASNLHVQRIDIERGGKLSLVVGQKPADIGDTPLTESTLKELI